ncbi:DMT family transporter [Candidimonas humi]|jgi:drug/metabolite transporter (DMT)-like permease|uniref:DMT family transporter n=1 Tax=Candidimonas humi TaxID=683355 RepID=A0ABV8P5E5_9BURK|nr:DMT family transporter [Candidimonas humi]MBV6307112.1 DMT family transporter [Candidimonas humi]
MATTSLRSRAAAYGCLALSMSLVGSYVALSRPLAAAMPVFLLAWLRFGIGAVAMLRWLRKPATEAPLSTHTRTLIFLESFLGNFLFTLCMVYGVSLSSAVSAGVIMSAIPATVALMSWLFLKERISPRTRAAVACGVLGIGLLALTRGGADGTAAAAGATTGNVLLGDLLLFGAVLCEASYAVIGKRLTAVLGPKRISAVINLWGFTLMTPFGLYSASRFDFLAVTPGIWLLLLFYGLAASVWTVWLWMTGLKSVPASQAGVFTVMLPISAALVGILVLGEPLSATQLLAFAIALAGLLLTTLPGRGKAA